MRWTRAMDVVRRPTPPAAMWRATLTATLVVGAVAALGVLVIGPPLRPASLVLPAMAVLLLPATSRRPAVRWLTSLAVIGLMAGWTLWQGGPPATVIVIAGLLAATAWLGTLMPDQLAVAEHEQIAARQDAEHRAEILAAVRRFSGSGYEAVSARVAEAISLLGFDAAGVATSAGLGGFEIRGDVTQVVGEEEVTRAVRTCVERGTPVALSMNDSDIIVVSAPLIVEGAAYGAVLAVGRRSGRTSEGVTGADEEAVEVLAAHLSTELSARRRLRRQQQFMDRLVQLERLRSDLVTTMSSQIRDPLTVVAGTAQFLDDYADDLDAEVREQLLARFTEQSRHLGEILERILDVSKLQRGGVEPVLARVDAVDLLAPALTAEHVECTPPLHAALAGRVVVADATILRPGLRLLTEDVAYGVVQATLDVAAGVITLRLVLPEGLDALALSRALATQLIVSGGGEVEVADTGPPAIVEIRLHEPFAQVAP